jgi:AraC-like DNA-binding protein
VGYQCDVSEVPGNLREFTICRDAAAIFAGFQDLWDRRFPFTRIELALPTAVDARLFEAFGCEVVLGCENTAFYWNPEVNWRPLPHGDPLLKEHYTLLWQRNMPRPGVADRLFARIFHELGSTGGAKLTLSRLARRLGLSERTLQRRLSERGLSFSDVLTEARKLKAMGMLGTDTLGVAEIAWRLGYSDVTSFNHAFRRWTGVSPNRYRADVTSGRVREGLTPDGLRGLRTSAV